MIALAQCDSEDALAVCTAFLEDHATGGPGLAPLFERTTTEAVLWADIAPPHELLAYGTAALNRLGCRSCEECAQAPVLGDLAELRA